MPTPEALVQLLILMLVFFVPLYFVIRTAVTAGIRRAQPETTRSIGHIA